MEVPESTLKFIFADAGDQAARILSPGARTSGYKFIKSCLLRATICFERREKKNEQIHVAKRAALCCASYLKDFRS